MEQLADQYSQINLAEVNFDTDLMRSVKLSSSPQEVSRMIQTRVEEVNVKDKEGFSPLHRAVLRCIEEDDCYGEWASEVIEQLIDKGADIDAVGLDGNTALHYALKNQLIPQYKILVEYGADINIKNNNGETALHFAVLTKCMETIKQLLAIGAKVNHTNIDGQTALHLAVSIVQGESIVQLLLEYGAEINKQDNIGQSPLHLAAEFNQSSVVEMLIEWGALVFIEDDNGKTPSISAKIDLYKYRAMKLKSARLISFSAFRAGTAYILTKNQRIKHIFRLNRFELKCINELIKLQKKTFGPFSLYDVLHNYNYPRLLMNEQVADKINEVIKSQLLKDEFPLYGTLLIANFSPKYRQRQQLLDEAQYSLHIPLPVPYNIVRMILSYLKNEDILSVIKSKEKL